MDDANVINALLYLYFSHILSSCSISAAPARERTQEDMR